MGLMSIVVAVIIFPAQIQALRVEEEKLRWRRWWWWLVWELKMKEKSEGEGEVKRKGGGTWVVGEKKGKKK